MTLDTVENLENGQVALVVYGDKGVSGPIMMTPPVKNGPAYRAGSSDEFKVGFQGVEIPACTFMLLTATSNTCMYAGAASSSVIHGCELVSSHRNAEEEEDLSHLLI